MKENFTRIGLASLCGWFGITRQAYYANKNEQVGAVIEEEFILREVLNIRSDHPRIGTRKLYLMLQPFIAEHNIKLGRDALFELLAANNLLIRKRKNSTRTTNSHHWLRKYPNLIREYVPTKPNQLWVSDLTYWKIQNNDFVYISLITDAYSRKILGYHVAETMEAIESINALEMALGTLNKQNGQLDLIHHSDRGVQYCSHGYVKLLQDCDVKISMTENGDPLENAMAERNNGIIKGEYLENYVTNNINEATKMLEKAVKLYNEKRPHMSISNLTPSLVHDLLNSIKPERLWKSYYKKKEAVSA